MAGYLTFGLKPGVAAFTAEDLLIDAQHVEDEKVDEAANRRESAARVSDVDGGLALLAQRRAQTHHKM